MSSSREEITRAVHELALPESQFRILSEPEAVTILADIEAHSVKRAGLNWWWEAFQDAPVRRIHFSDGTGWRHLVRIVPPKSGFVWFVVEDAPQFVLCEAIIESVQSVIGECWAFEYYVVAQNLDWLVCENHHDVLYAVGMPVVDRLTQEIST